MKNLLLIPLMILSCEKSSQSKKEILNDSLSSTQAEVKPVEQKTNDSETEIKNLNTEILQALENEDYKRFQEFIHPEKGIRFSMYAFVDTSNDKKFSKADFDRYIGTETKFTFGEKDGTGDLYIVSLKDYLKNWVYSKKYSEGSYTFNSFQGSGNSLNNLQKVYPDKDFTENYLAGTEEYAQMDWKALRFVFEKLNDKYFLIAVINDQWTI